MAKRAKLSMVRRGGFTLIELLVVIVILAVLAAILTHVIGEASKRIDDRNSQLFVLRVARAAEVFKGQNNGRYPGQDDIGQLKGTTPQPGRYTGSQIIAARLFGYSDSDISSPNPKSTNKYLEYKSHLLISKSSTGANIPNNSMADDSGTANALLYFPSRLNVTAPSECYKWNDNSIYITKNAPSAQFIFNENCAKDPKFSSPNNARQPGGILIIGTGANDVYLERDNNDDITNWKVD